MPVTGAPALVWNFFLFSWCMRRCRDRPGAPHLAWTSHFPRLSPMRSAVFDISFQCSYPSNEHRHKVRTWDNAATNTCTDLSHVKTEHNRLQQEPITRNVQLHCICGTAFLQTELFLDWFPRETRPFQPITCLAWEISTHGIENGHSCKPSA